MRTLFLLAAPAVFFGVLPMALAQVSPSAQPANKIAVMDGGAGPCSLELTVTTADGKPAYAVNVNVHIAYGFGGFHRLDLEAGTNVEGKVKFIGLPSRVHQPPLEFKAANDQFVGMAAYNPDQECQAKHELVLDKPKPQ
jgi:hypothetical protein